tara:strand:- start:352 stop:1434 length:1083 start_codon:yes stop_codon:yes gene_type:complete
MESIEQTINGSVGPNSRVTSTISRNGDLVYRLFYEVTGKISTDLATGVSNPGAAIFDNVEVEIGGQRIDRQTGQWMHTWASLTEENNARVMAGEKGEGGTLFQELTGMGGTNNTGDGSTTAEVIDLDTALRIPLSFWFCRNPGLALPLIALQYHEVKVVTSFSSVFPAAATTAGVAAAAKLWADYIYLDTDERRRFAQVSHEYLIEQVQFQAGASSTVSTELNFNHPVKELVWTAGFVSGVQATALTGAYHLKLNGHDRMASRDTQYYTKQQVWMHHTGPGGLTDTAGDSAGKVGCGADTIAVYSFALKPEEHQPSGTCNFSRIDNAQLYSTVAETRDVFAVNYNVLRIMSGMGGLAYSN